MESSSYASFSLLFASTPGAGSRRLRGTWGSPLMVKGGTRTTCPTGRGTDPPTVRPVSTLEVTWRRLWKYCVGGLDWGLPQLVSGLGGHGGGKAGPHVAADLGRAPSSPGTLGEDREPLVVLALALRAPVATFFSAGIGSACSFPESDEDSL
uniref:Uncharacterized protein n=1 Tax=Ixodes ricinus TaxID=34613 RepID=A0A6B0UW85_IXORI